MIEWQQRNPIVSVALPGRCNQLCDGDEVPMEIPLGPSRETAKLDPPPFRFSRQPRRKNCLWSLLVDRNKWGVAQRIVTRDVFCTGIDVYGIFHVHT